MNVVFVGYRKWSNQILKNLINQSSPGWRITGIITTDKTKNDFTKFSLPCLIVDPTIHAHKFADFLRKCNTDVCLFYGWSWIISKDIYNNYLCLILHPSPIPRYRGGSPIQHQIINGETTSAVTILKVDEKIDAGNIYMQTPFSLIGTLENIFTRIVTIGTKDTIKVLDAIANNTIRPIPQDESKATIFKRRKPEDSEITIKDLKTKTSIELYNFIRALADPYPNAFIKCRDGKNLFVTSAKLAP